MLELEPLPDTLRGLSRQLPVIRNLYNSKQKLVGVVYDKDVPIGIGCHGQQKYSTLSYRREGVKCLILVAVE